MDFILNGDPIGFIYYYFLNMGGRKALYLALVFDLPRKKFPNYFGLPRGEPFP